MIGRLLLAVMSVEVWMRLIYTSRRARSGRAIRVSENSRGGLRRSLPVTACHRVRADQHADQYKSHQLVFELTDWRAATGQLMSAIYYIAYVSRCHSFKPFTGQVCRQISLYEREGDVTRQQLTMATCQLCRLASTLTINS